MASIVSAGTTSSTALNMSADTTGILQLASNNGTVALTVDTSQRVGIGTTSPGANLEVKGASGQNIYVSYTSGSQLRLKSDSGDSGVGTTGSTPLLFLISNGEVARFDTSGNLGIGTSALSGYKLCVGNTSSVTTLNGVGLTLFTSGGLTSNIGGVLNFRPALGQTASDIFNLSICAYDHSGDGNADGLSINGADGVSFSTGGNSRSERVRIDSSGKVTVGAVAQTKGNFCLYNPANTQTNIYFNRNAQVEGYIGFNSSDTNFYFGSGGSFTANGVYLANSTNSWSSVSDERLKENLVPIADAMTKVSSLRAVTGNFIADVTKASRSFLIAQDVQKVLPEAISTTVRDEIEYLGVSYTDTIPLLVAAINELTAKVTALEEQVLNLGVK